MMTPYEILGVNENANANANDAEIKRAYLQKVKQNTPERDQQQFKKIHDAYTSIKDYKSRLSYSLFTLPAVDFDLLVDQALQTESTVELSAELFQQFLNVSVDESSLLKTVEK